MGAALFGCGLFFFFSELFRQKYVIIILELFHRVESHACGVIPRSYRF